MIQPIPTTIDAMTTIDTLVIGGGINGVGIAADLAGRGLSVLLVEKNDLASATSQYSSKLIHGGLRYLEQMAFQFVKESLHERALLLSHAPHLVKPLRFIMPHHQRLRPAWMIHLGLFLYDFMSTKDPLPSSRSIQFKETLDNPLSYLYKKGFEYFDCQVDDARLVITVAQLARQKGASILTNTRFMQAHRENGLWKVQLRYEDHSLAWIAVKSIVNATGPWVEMVEHEGFHVVSQKKIRLVKGSHILIPKLYKEDNAYILQNEDGRVIFVMPFEHCYTLIGTTDIPYEGDPAKATITEAEVTYLCNAVNAYFKHTIHPQNVLGAYAGVRPLKNEPTKNVSKISRDYTFELQGSINEAPLLNIIGGKLTTYRALAEVACEKLRPFFPNMQKAWTHSSPLPGGDFQGTSFTEYTQKMAIVFAWLPKDLLTRYLNAYGSHIEILLEGCHQISDLKEYFGAGLYQKEIEYLIKYEWAKTLDDILWRRTKLGLHIRTEDLRILKDWFATQHPA